MTDTHSAAVYTSTQPKTRKTAPRTRLTKRIVDAAPCPKRGQRFIRDATLPGFALRLTPGSKTFILERRVLGRVRRITLGAYGPLTVEQARTKAIKMAGRIANGEDPAQERIDARGELTFGAFIEIYVERHGPKKQTIAIDKKILDRYVSDWKTRRLSTVTRSDVAQRHSKAGKGAGPYAANRLLALISKMFNLARLWGHYEGENPATGIQKFAEHKRDRFIQPEELPRLFTALDAEEDPYVKAALKTSLLTGARIGEVLTMKWTDLHLDQALWHIPKTKAGRPHLIPLPGPLLDVLRSLKRWQGVGWVFPSHGKTGHLSDLSRAWERIRTEANIPDVRIHDLRRTLGSWLAVAGASLPLIGKVLNHSQASTTQVYARLHLEPVREALETNAQKMMALGKKPGPENQTRAPKAPR